MEFQLESYYRIFLINSPITTRLLHKLNKGLIKKTGSFDQPSNQLPFYFIKLQKRQMEPKNQEPLQEGQCKSPFDHMLQAIEDRVRYFNKNHLSLQSELLKMPGESPKTISDIIPSLGTYYFNESPVQPKLRDLYSPQYQQVPQRCILPPPSQGQDSVQIQSQAQSSKKVLEPTFSWLSKAIIDSTLLTVDQVEAKKLERNREVPADWGGVTELLIFNISKKIHQKSEAKSIDKYLHWCVSIYPVVVFQKIRKIYYKGKPSALIKFKNQKSCCFAYYNFSKSEEISRRETLGPNSEVFRVISNRTNSLDQQKWIAVMFRMLPLSLTKETFLDVLRKRSLSPVWMEDLIQIESYYYTLCKVTYLEEVFQFCTCFQINPPIKNVKVNLHPKSCKVWSPRENQGYIPLT